MPKPPHVWTYANRYPAQDAFAALVRSEPGIRQSDAVRRLGYRVRRTAASKAGERWLSGVASSLMRVLAGWCPSCKTSAMAASGDCGPTSRLLGW